MWERNFEIEVLSSFPYILLFLLTEYVGNKTQGEIRKYSQNVSFQITVRLELMTAFNVMQM